MGREAEIEELRALLGAARRRLRGRAAARAGAVGAWAGAGAGVLIASFVAVLGMGPLAAASAGLSIAASLTAAAAIAGACLPTLTPREAALLLDRRLGTHELLVTALHVTAATDGRTAAIPELRGAVGRIDLRRTLPILVPKHARFLPIAAVIGLGASLLPPVAVDPLQRWLAPEAPSTVQAEGARLARRLEALSREPGALPPDLQDHAARVGEEMVRGQLTEEEARVRLADLQEQLSRFAATATPSDAVAEALEHAAEALRSAPTSTEAERQAAARRLSESAERLSRSGDPAARDAAEAIARGADSLRSGPLDDERSDEIAERLEDIEDQAARARSAEAARRGTDDLNGALEASRQRLGGEPSVDPGRTGAPDGGAREEPGPAQAGDAHTWEETAEDASSGEQRTQPTGTNDRVVDDFERLYAPVRLDVDPLLASERGRIDERGQIEELSTRRTAGDERATLPRLSLPTVYEQAAAEAIRTESIPPGYRDAVKQYFDGLQGEQAVSHRED